MARQQSAAAQEKDKNETLMLYSCGQSYESGKAHAEHLKSTFSIGLNVNEHDENEEEDEDDYGDLDPPCCFMCDEKHDTIESCIVHLHKQHGFFIPDVDYVGEQGKQLVASGESANNVELGTGGSELIIIKKSNDGHGMSTKTLGSREFLRYYRQKPRPSPANNMATAAARHRSMCLASVQSKEHRMRLKVLKERNRSGVETMRSKIAMKTKSNMIRNLPKNLPRQTRNRTRKCSWTKSSIL